MFFALGNESRLVLRQEDGRDSFLEVKHSRIHFRQVPEGQLRPTRGKPIRTLTRHTGKLLRKKRGVKIISFVLLAGVYHCYF